ncbi:MAG: hypothetical protein JO233_00615 [Candidatus Eremiobacteraeota bacterium]|nr:hypothetical protein [Candidatus Eremiobacteraeota bacterium]
MFQKAPLAPKAGAAVISACLLLIATKSAVCADQGVFAAVNAPVINISINGGTVNIRTWDRPQVQTDSTVPLQVQQFSSAAMTRNVPREIAVLAGQIDSPRGALTLPRETFVVGAAEGTPHDGFAITGTGGETTITIPNSTALLVTRMQHGLVTLDGYRTGTFFVRLRTGWVHLSNMGGEGFVQVMRGPIVANDSSFLRLRARSALGNIMFERCHARQIEVSTVAGTIGYDNGSFEPGLARFESQYGAVALGIGSGNAQIAAHSDGGRILYNYDRRVNVEAHGNDASAAVGAGGPLINVSSGGAVLLYDGMLRSRNRLNGGWRAAGAVLNRVQQRVNKPPPQIHRPPPMRRIRP